LTHDAFISYPREDKAAADAACATLETAGIRCWIAPRDILPGAEWGATIVDAIDHSAVMVLIFSTNANDSPQIRREVEHAVDKGVMIVPVRIDRAEPMRSLAYFMAGVHWLDALTPPLEHHLQALAISIKAFLSAASANPSRELGQIQPNPASSASLERPGVAVPEPISGRADDEPEKKEQPRGRRTPCRGPLAIAPERAPGRGADEEGSPRTPKEWDRQRQTKELPLGDHASLPRPPTITPETAERRSHEQEGIQHREVDHAPPPEMQKESDGELKKSERPQEYRTFLRRPAGAIPAITAVLLAVVIAWVLVPRQASSPPIAPPVTPSPAPKIAATEALQKGDDAYHQKNYAEALFWYRNAADQGNAQANGNIGRLYFLGQGVPVDYGEAMRWLRRAADQGNADARVHIGVLYEQGRGGLTKDDREAARFYKRAADQGNALAQANLGFFYEQGRGGLTKDDHEAASLYKVAADQGNALAQTNLGIFYEQGRGGLTKDDREAARLYKRAADQGNALAQANLGVFYEQGRGGLTKDNHEAASLYKLAADQGNALAQTNLGIFYEQGRGGLTTDDHEAASLYKLAANQGNALAQTNLGIFYEQGRGGLTKDDREAARLYKLAADQGIAQARYNLGVFYEQGRGGLTKDHQEVAPLFKFAADQGYAPAQYNIRGLYEDGIGVAKEAEFERDKVHARSPADIGEHEVKTPPEPTDPGSHSTRHPPHSKQTALPGKISALTGSTTAQLNRQELARHRSTAETPDRGISGFFRTLFH
jgi:TPR repeat protein